MIEGYFKSVISSFAGKTTQPFLNPSTISCLCWSLTILVTSGFAESDKTIPFTETNKWTFYSLLLRIFVEYIQGLGKKKSYQLLWCIWFSWQQRTTVLMLQFLLNSCTLDNRLSVPKQWNTKQLDLRIIQIINRCDHDNISETSISHLQTWSNSQRKLPP